MKQRLTPHEIHQRQRTSSGVLTPEQVGLIKWKQSRGATDRQLAKEYCMSVWAMRAIRKGETWGWVEAQGEVLATDVEIEEAAKQSFERFMERSGQGGVVVPQPAPTTPVAEVAVTAKKRAAGYLGYEVEVSKDVMDASINKKP